MDKKVIEKFANHILIELELTDWHMEWDRCSGGICIKEFKKITIPKRMIGTDFEAKEYVLHEIAHIFTDDNQHGTDFYKQYIKLLQRFMT